MSQLQIQIVSIDVGSGTTTTKKPYKFLDIVYKNKSFDDKIENKKLTPFSNKEVFDVLETSSKGDIFDITREKNKNGFWEWIQINTATEKSKPASSFHFEPKNNDTQLQIIRQSSLTNAVRTLASGLDPDIVQNTANIYVDFVLGTQKTMSSDIDTDDIEFL